MLKSRATALAAVLAAAFLSKGAAAQTPPPAAQVEASTLAQRPAGPAWWRISDADSEVWVMATPESMPKGTAFDDAALRERLTGANTLIVPPTNADTALFMLKANQSGRKDYPALLLDKRLPADLDQRYQTAFRKVNAVHGTGGVDYRGELNRLPTIHAAEYLSQGSAKVMPLDNSAIARASAIITPMRSAAPKIVFAKSGQFSLFPVLDLVQLDEPIAETCLTQMIGWVEATDGKPDTRTDGAKAWAQGDVLNALKSYDPIFQCDLGDIGQAFWLTAERADIDAITDALAKPGKSVAILEFTPLLAKGGALDQLEAKGFKVEWPY